MTEGWFLFVILAMFWVPILFVLACLLKDRLCK